MFFVSRPPFFFTVHTTISFPLGCLAGLCRRLSGAKDFVGLGRAPWEARSVFSSLRSGGGWQLATQKPDSNPIAAGKHKAAMVKEDEGHGDRVAADAPFRVV